jgi:pimeloyl-ACP methyl ester carboxylesterase
MSSFRKSVGRALGVLLVVTVVALAVAYIFFRRDLGAARNRLARIHTQVYSSTISDIEYLLVGQGPTVLVSHGVTGGIDQGMALTNEFEMFAEGYRFLYVSRFGYLRSSMPANASSRRQAAAYRELMDHLGIDRVFVFGNSAGGPSAMWFAVDYPERTQGLILQSSAVPGAQIAATPPLVFQYDFAYWLAVKTLPGTLLNIFVPKRIRLTGHERDFLVAHVFESALPISERSEGILFDNQISTPSVGQIPFERITAPTLILHAADDPAPPIEGARDVARRIPKSELVVLDGGHFLLRHGTQVMKKTREFVSRHD